MVIAPALAGFTAGTVYVAYPNATGTATVLASIPAGGGAPAPIGSISGTFDHVGLIFDTSGLYGGALLLVTESGQLFTYNGSTISASGAISTPAGVNLHIESPAISPIGFGPLGGLLWFVNEGGDEAGDNKLYAVTPGTFKAQAVIAIPVGGNPPRAESIAFVSPSACAVPIPGQTTSATLLDALFGLNQLAFYNAPATFAYVNIEYDGNLLQLAYNGVSYSFSGSPFDTGLGQQEHLTAGVCLSFCTLTQGGYKNNFNSRVTNFPGGGLVLGGTFYTNSDLNKILQNNAVKGNGLISLAHQLITAMLNVAYGALPTSAQAQAIQDANSLIATIQPPGTKVIPPLGSGFLSPSATSALETTLDQFNSSKECQ
ncbi:MAG: hypothetical protein C5B51_10470 [Terriglobia bacterium]|nr:MAG: hypothetical protein C5B51_10470 [Terriglobia bacterium]